MYLTTHCPYNYVKCVCTLFGHPIFLYLPHFIHTLEGKLVLLHFCILHGVLSGALQS